MDNSRLYRRVFSKLLWSPWTVTPAALGGGALTFGAATGNWWWMFLGFSGFLTACGTLATNWILRGDSIARQAVEELQNETLKQREAKLNDLDRRLRKDKDPTDERIFQQLREYYQAFKDAVQGASLTDRRISFEVTSKVEDLFRACVNSLERSLELKQAAAQMATQQGRRATQAQREQLLEEVAQSVQHMAAIVDDIHALRLEQNTQNLARLRQELDESIDVARRVEDRMRSLEAELGGRISTVSEPEG
jgi:hypothetical protein